MNILVMEDPEGEQKCYERGSEPIGAEAAGYIRT